MTKQIGLAKHAYRGAPAPPTKSVLAKVEDDRPPKILPEDDWSFKNKKVRRQEIIDRL